MLEVNNISKSFADIQAVKDVSFSVQPGAFYGLLGPNGAGKSTTINIISTALAPDHGSVLIDGLDISKNKQACKLSLGIVPQEIALYEMLSAYDNLLFWGSLYKLPATELKQTINETLDLLGLLDRKNDKVSTYSGGMKRRINIAAALLHRPKLLLMDEPTVGIDPQSRNLIFEVLERLHRNGMTIIYTTHYMEEAERLCKKIGIIDHGKIIAQGDLNELKGLVSSQESIRVTTDVLDDALKATVQGKWGNRMQVESEQLVLETDHADQKLSDFIGNLNQIGVPIKNIAIEPVNLENIFMQLTGRQLRD
ncbi:MAG: ABC transporter ATP-binding protein [Cyclobacteriaceae bacterium]